MSLYKVSSHFQQLVDQVEQVRAMGSLEAPVEHKWTVDERNMLRPVEIAEGQMITAVIASEKVKTDFLHLLLQLVVMGIFTINTKRK
jgi:hypothetical protein